MVAVLWMGEGHVFDRYLACALWEQPRETAEGCLPIRHKWYRYDSDQWRVYVVYESNQPVICGGGRKPCSYSIEVH